VVGSGSAFRLIILRDVLRQRVRTGTTIAGIALGIAVVLAIQLASSAALRGFASSVESLAGRATLEVTQPPLGIDERRLPSLIWLQDYGQVTPVIEGEASWTPANGADGSAGGSAGRSPQPQVLKVLGIDILTDLAFRDYAFTDREPREQTTRDLLALLTDADAIILTESFARAHGLNVGSPVRLAIGDDVRTQTFHIRALLRDRGPARALGGNLIVMDIAAAQVALGRLGYIDRLELRIDDSTQLDRIEADVTKRLNDVDGGAASAGAADAAGRARTTGGADTTGAASAGVADGAGRAGATSGADTTGAASVRRSPSGAQGAAVDAGGAGGELVVQRPSRRGRQVEKMQAAFRSNLTALSTIALIAGLFLVYNTVSASVLYRRQEIGMLRAVGASRGLVFALFLGEALALAIPGCLLGLVVGRVLAQGAMALTAGTVSRMYVPAAAAVPASLDSWHVALAFLVGIPLALIAAAAPAWEAARIPPTDAIRRGLSIPPAARRMRAVVAIVSFALAAWLCTFDAIDGLPLAGYLATFFIIVGTTALTAPLVLLAAGAARALFGRLFFVEPWLATTTLVEYARRMSVSVAALAVSLAMTVAIAVMVSSFRETVIYWVSQTLVADLYVGPVARRAGALTATVPAEVEAIVRAQPGVTAVDGFRVMDVPYRDARIFVTSGHYDALLSRTRLLFKSPSDPREVLRASMGRDAAIVTEAFALRYRLRVGDSVTLPTPGGAHAFPIIAIYYDYASDRGTVLLDAPIFARYFGERRPMGLNVYLAPHTDVDAARRDLVRALGGIDRTGGGITVFTNSWLRGEVLRIFDGTFAITWALEVVAILVAVMGIVATLVTAIDERRRELAMLRLVGASRGQVQRMVVVEAAILGAIGQTLGLIAGFGLSFVLVYVINVQSFGWSIQFHTPVLFLFQLAVSLIIATSLAALYPARRAARTYLTEQAAHE
jgi:putative ABC transport system permease protein